MTRTTILALFSVLSIGLLLPAYADNMPPLKQYNMGIPNDMIQCNTGKVLVESSSGKAACIYDSTAKKLENRGWTVMLSEKISMTDVSEMEINDSIILDTQSINEISDVDKISVTTKASDDGHGMYIDYRSDTILTYPSSVNIGDEFTINYIIDPKNQTSNNLIEKNDAIGIKTPTEFNVITESDRTFFSGIDKYEKHGRITYVFTFTDDMIDSNELNGSIKLRLDAPLIHEYDEISFHAGVFGYIPISIERTSTGIHLSHSTNMSSLVSDDPDRYISIEGDAYTFNLESYVPQERRAVGQSDCMTETEWNKIRNNHEELRKYDNGICITDPIPILFLPEKSWEGYADFLRWVQSDFNVTNIEDYLQNSTDFTQEFIDKYLNAYPEFRVQSFIGGDASPPPHIFVLITSLGIQDSFAANPEFISEITIVTGYPRDVTSYTVFIQ